MATTVIFGNKVCKLPGSYARVVSGIPRETPLASYNNFLLIDAGFGNGFDSLKGIKTQGAGKECVFALDEEQANYFVKGGPLEPVITALFHPDDENDKPGISTLYLIKAASTIQGAAATSGTPAVVSLFGGKITASALKTAEHGAICNTYPTDITSVANLKKGFALVCKYDAGISKGWIEIWEGTYGGTNYGGFEVSNTEANSAPVMVYRSKKCSNTEELVAYLNNPNSGFSSFIEATNLTSVTSAFGSTNIDELTKFSGGSDTYISTGADLANILGYTLDSDYSCMMVAEANGATNFLAVALDHIINDAKGIKQIITAKADQEDAIILARENDNDALIVTANQGKNKSKVSSTGFIDHDALVTAAKIGGRIFGLSPEIPGTLKSLGFDGMVTEPSDADLETMLAAGQCLAQTFFEKVINIPLKLDGGNVICNSEYVFISEKLYTENLGISKKEIDKFFEETFEQKLITLPTEVLDVVGHTDCILRFLDDKTIALPIYDSEYKIDNRYVMNIKRILSEKLGLDYKFVFLPSYLDDSINEDNIFSARGLFLNYFRFEDHIVFPEFQDLGYYQNRIIENMRKYAPDIKIHFSPCDDIAFYGGCFNCISNFKYR